MKTPLISNFFLSGSLILGIFFIEKYLAKPIPIEYYIAPVFYLLLYCIQFLLLNKKNDANGGFVMMYNFTTAFKMIFSVLFIIVYYMFFSHSLTNGEKIQFSLFFSGLYFIYLILNIKLLFKATDAKK